MGIKSENIHQECASRAQHLHTLGVVGSVCKNKLDLVLYIRTIWSRNREPEAIVNEEQTAENHFNLHTPYLFFVLCDRCPGISIFILVSRYRQPVFVFCGFPC